MNQNTKSSDESSSSNLNSSFKCNMNDNDSGYISQHIESHSLGEVSDYNNHIFFSTSNNMYLNEDTLLENPVKAQTEHENLFYMSDFSNTIIPPSVSSHGDSFHVFDSEDSEVVEETDVSLVIPTVDPIVVTDINMQQIATTNEEGSRCGSFIVDNENKENENDLKESSSVELNLFKSSQIDENVDKSVVSTSKTNNLSCVQTRIMDAHNCNMSLFESFYSFVCDLYTEEPTPFEDPSNIAVNPRDLLVTQVNEQLNSYIELETRSVQDLPSSNTLPTVSTANLSESPTTSFVSSFLNPIHAEDSSSNAIASCSPKNATDNSKDVDPVKIINNDSTSITSSEAVKPSTDGPNFVGAFNSVGEHEMNSFEGPPNLYNSSCSSESVSKLPEPPKVASSLVNENDESEKCLTNNENVSIKTTIITESEAVKPSTDGPNFVGAFNSVGEHEMNSFEGPPNWDNSSCSSESVSKLPEPPKVVSSVVNENSESEKCLTNNENVSIKTTIITEHSAIIAKATELSKMATKRTDPLRGRNALASKTLRPKSKEIKIATPAKSILKKPQDVDSSPELFSDEEILASRLKPGKPVLPVHKERDELYVTQTDRKLFKRAQESITGVLPPPSVTILQITIDEMLDKIKGNTHLFWDNTESSSNNEGASTSKSCESPPKKESLLVRCKKTDFNPEAWPDVLNYRYHGLHFNRNTLSEDFESLCTKYTERHIGAETQSSCTVFGINAVQSPSKHRCRLKRTAKSPGKRLSYLANTKRRITFSKDSLNASGSSSCAFGARTRQIMVDVRKCQMLKHKSPKKKTPVKSPRKKLTPSSSAKKRFSRRLRMYSIDDSTNAGASTSNSISKLSATKRALFQSPPQRSDNGGCSTLSHSKDAPTAESSQETRRRTPRRALFPSPLKVSPIKMAISSLYPSKSKQTPKRALFTSPEKSSRSASANDRKRKRTDSDCEQPSKVAKNLTDDMKKLTKGMQNATKVSASTTTSQNIIDNRKKKLMWSVAEALRLQNIDLKHPQFKVYASVLARVIRSFLPNLFVNGSRSEGGTTESMLRIARKYVFAVTRGKSVDYIMKEAENEKLKALKPSGYVSINKIECNNTSQSKHKEGVLQDRLNIISTEKDVAENNKNVRRGGNVERIRRVINFGDDDFNNTSIR